MITAIRIIGEPNSGLTNKAKHTVCYCTAAAGNKVVQKESELWLIFRRNGLMLNYKEKQG